SSWRSRTTGLNVVHLDYEGERVAAACPREYANFASANLYIVLQFAVFNDTGCPHTWNSDLVFMGSEKYPYKGIIDRFANRGGILANLPIYVDHILYPTISKAGFTTEVHHIDPQGEDSGRENTSLDLMALHERLLNPPGSAYRSETGGLMDALRKLTVEQIRDYHKTYYVPHNLSLIVAGKFSNGTETLLSLVQNEVEPSIIAHGRNEGPKPPGKDESTGELWINYMGPHNDILSTPRHACSAPLDIFDAKLYESFRRIIKDGVDLNRMKMVIDRDERQEALDRIKLYNLMRTWSSKQWTELIEKFSPESQGTGRAKAEHEKPIPTEVLKSFPVPDVKSISWIPVQSVQQAGTGRKSVTPTLPNDVSHHVSGDGPPLPFFSRIQSEFVSVHAYLSLARLPSHLRPFIQPYIGSFFSLPVKRRSGERLSHEEVVDQLDEQTVFYDMLHVTIRVELAKYEDLLYGSEFTKERLQITVAQMQQSLPRRKRRGSTVLWAVTEELLHDENSTTRAAGVLIQSDFIRSLSEKIQEAPEEVIEAFESIRRIITDPTGVRFSVTGNILGVPKPRDIWNKYFGDALPEAPLSPVPLASDLLSNVGKNPVKRAIVVTLPTIESPFVNHVGKGIQGFDHPDYPALRVAAEVLSATESFLWRYIRGSGLAYGVFVQIELEAGHIVFSLYRSSNSLEAFKQGAIVVSGLVDGSIALEDTVLDAAKSSIVFDVTMAVSTPSRAAETSFANQALKGVSQNHDTDLFEKYQKVNKDDVLRVLQRYFLPLFDASTSVVVSVTAPGKAEEISKGLKDAGFDVERRKLEVDHDDGSESGSESESDESK
ncbi:hypothetical protein BJV77DRAFT_1056481, partial [Russula vinacea]